MANSGNQDIQVLLQALKRILRAQGLVYADVAAHIGVSEITVKRLLSGTSISMKYLLALCDFLHVSFLEVAALAREAEYPEYILTREQDQSFAKNPKLYAIFIDLYRRKPASEVKSHWELSEQSFFKCLRDLEKMQLLDVLPRNGYRFRITGPIRVPRQGQLKEVFFKQNRKFLDHVQKNIEKPGIELQTSEILISKKHAENFLRETQALIKKLRSQAFLDESMLSSNLKSSVRLLFAYASYETDWRNES